MKIFFYRYWKRLSGWALNFLFPVECIFCGSQEDWMCSACCGMVPRQTVLSCFICRRPTLDGQWCDACRGRKVIRGIWAPTAYATLMIREGIHSFKYESLYVLAGSLASFLIQFVREWPFLFSSSTLFISVPLHERRFLERGYNQSHLLVTHFLKERGGVCGCWLLRRVRHTKPQVSCTKEERTRNVEGAFEYRGPRNIRWPRVVLIDDVSTTGSTLEACAQVLRSAGAHEIWGFVLARG